MMSFDMFRELCRLDLTSTEADETTLKRFYNTRRTPREAVAYIRWTLKRTTISHQKARGILSVVGWNGVKHGREAVSMDEVVVVGLDGKRYYTRPNV